jgi:tetratricopeptide (TPR) repeat protein
MAVQDLLEQGWRCEAAGDLSGAEAAYREADELGDAEGAMLLGQVIKRRGDAATAADAFRRAEARGHREAGLCLGNLLSDNGDPDGAAAAYKRSIAAGSTDAVLNLGLILAKQGAADEALGYLRVAQDSGAAEASWAIGRLLEGRQDYAAAAAAYRRGADGGDPQAAYGLGVVLMDLEDHEGARAAFQRAHELGHSGAAQVLESLDMRATARASAETGAKWAKLYAAACGEVLTATNACLPVANRAIGARNKAAERPQHEMSIRTFTQYADRAEQKFGPLYKTFDEASVAARDAAAQLLASQSDPIYSEVLLAGVVDEDALGNVATTKALLSASYGRHPAEFVRGIQEANEMMQRVDSDEEEGNIYRPPAAAQATERTCPW